MWLLYDVAILWYGMVIVWWYGICYHMVWCGGADGMAMACRRGNHPFLLAVIIDLQNRMKYLRMHQST